MLAEPSTLTIHDHSARAFMVFNEVQIVAEIEIEYRGGGWWKAWLDDGVPAKPEDPWYPDYPSYVSRSLADAQAWAASTMEEQADKARATCGCGTDGMDDPPGRGNFACGVMSPHGISTTITDGDGNDVTDDYRLNRM